MVWISGPLFGAVLQPMVGAFSDGHRSTWGRRRPFILLGTCFVVASLIGLAYVDLTAHSLRVQGDATLRWPRQAAAVALVFTLNAAIQPIQCCSRALIIDVCPATEQETANAWAGGAISVANTVSYTIGFLDFDIHFPFFHGTEFGVTCIWTAAALMLTTAVTITHVNEPLSNDPPVDEKCSMKNDAASPSTLCQYIRSLPASVIMVLRVQFLSWLSWFPFLFYISR